MTKQKQKVQKIFANVTKQKYIHEAVLLVENAKGDVSYRYEYGGKTIDSPILIASITKLFTTACLFMLREQGKLSLDDMIAKYLDKDTMSHLHVYKGREYSGELTISHLLFHTSGLRDALEEGGGMAKERAALQDVYIDFDKNMIKTKAKKPHFAPGQGKRAHYANINFEMLGKIIETVTHSRLEDVFKQFIFDPLGLHNTYLPQAEDDVIPSIYYKDTALHFPQYVSSIRASGGCVSTARELMVFIKAFFKGELFDRTVLGELKDKNKLQLTMLPIQYGAGYMRVPLGGLATLYMGQGELMGHSGSTGSLAFYYPEQDMFFVGDVNQMASPAIPVRLAMQLAMSMRS